MINEACPNCSTPVSPPGGAHGVLGQTMHSHTECPSCGRPLIWFTEGELATGWRKDEAEERRLRLIAEAGE